MTPTAERADESAAAFDTVLALRKASGLHVAFVGLITDTGELRIGPSSGVTAEGSCGLVVAKGAGLGGKVLLTGRPATVDDYVAARSISHEYDGYAAADGLRAVVAVPVTVGRTVRGVLYGGTRERGPLGDRVLSTAMSAGRELEQALAVRERADGLLAEARSTLVGTLRRECVAWEQVREVHTELLGLLGKLDDVRLSERLHAVCSTLASAYGPERASLPPPPALSPREVQVLAGVAAGHTNPDIAALLGVGLETVKSHLRSATRKLGTRTRLEAVTVARRSGLLP